MYLMTELNKKRSMPLEIYYIWNLDRFKFLMAFITERADNTNPY